MIHFLYMPSLISFLPWIQIILSVLLAGAVLLQRNEAGLGSAFGSSGAAGPNFTKRGFERTLFLATIALAILFALSILLPEIIIK